MKKAENFYRVGFDLGGTKMFAVIFDQNFKSLSTFRCPSQGHLGKAVGMQNIINSIIRAKEKADKKFGKLNIKSIGLGVPGIVNKSGVMLDAPNLGWQNVKFKKALEKKFACKVAVLNDVDAGTLGEYHFGAGKKSKSLLGVFPGTGIGGGFVHEGKLFTGTKYSCMEIGHMKLPFAKNGENKIGEPVTWETLCSRLNIASEVALAAYRGKAPFVYKKYGTDLSKIKSSAISSAIKAGNSSVEKIVKNSIAYLSLCISNAIYLLAPDTILLGGGLAESMPTLYKKEVNKMLKKFCDKFYLEDLKVCISKLGDESVALGAAFQSKVEN